MGKTRTIYYKWCVPILHRAITPTHKGTYIYGDIKKFVRERTIFYYYGSTVPVPSQLFYSLSFFFSPPYPRDTIQFFFPIKYGIYSICSVCFAYSCVCACVCSVCTRTSLGKDYRNKGIYISSNLISFRVLVKRAEGDHEEGSN